MKKRPLILRKSIKFIFSPGVFFRDYFNRKYPVIRNEILCPEDEESILVRNDLHNEELLSPEFPIDVVFTWVNDKDPIWQEKYNLHKDKKTNEYGLYATDQARFSNNDELYYAIKSVLKFIAWVRRIYLVTDEQAPEWINEYPQVVIVHHKDIIDKKYLPTFNSHVIEAHLHKISGLAEHFIYFNDDVFVARPLPPGHFFRSNGVASIFLSHKNITDMQERGVTTPTLSASLRVSDLLYKEFRCRVITPLVHTYMPLRRSMFESVWEQYDAEIKSFLPNKFRTDKDLNLATFLVPWFSYFKREAIPARDICYYFNIRSPVAKHYYSSLIKHKYDGAPHSFCANDFTITKKNVDDYQSSLINMLTSFYSNGKKDA